MKHNHNAVPFLSGVFVTLLLVSLILPVSALSGKNVTIYPGVNIYVNDQKIDPRDANGNPIEAFIYNGSTYLPVRAVSEALNQPVQWDGSTSSVYIGKHSSDKPATWLKDLNYFYTTLYYNETWSPIQYKDTCKDNIGTTHNYIFTNEGTGVANRTYLLNGQYSKLTGTFFQTYEARSSSHSTTLTIMGDGEILYKSTMEKGAFPEDFEINLTGVLQLDIKFTGLDSTYDDASAALGECALWT